MRLLALKEEHSIERREMDAKLASDLEDFRSRAVGAAEELIRDHDPDGVGTSQNSVSAALEVFEEHGLLSLDFLRSDGDGPSKGVFGPVPARDVRLAVIAVETLAAHSGSLASIDMVNVVLGGAVITLAGTAEQRARLLGALRSARLQIAFAMTEPEAGSDAGAISTSPRRDGSAIVIDGEKLYITGAASADVLLVVARSPEGAEGDRAFGVFLVPANAAGVSIEPLGKLAAGAHASCRIPAPIASVRPRACIAPKCPALIDLPDRPDMLVAPDFVVGREERSIEGACQGDDHAICRILMKRAGQSRGLDPNVIVHGHKSKAIDASGDIQPIIDTHSQCQALPDDEHPDLPGGDSRHQDHAALGGLFGLHGLPGTIRKLRIAVDPPDEGVGVENDHPDASQSSSATGPSGSLNSTTLPRSFSSGERLSAR